MSKGKFKEALNENFSIMNMHDHIPQKDKALFNMALIYAHHDNPEKDYNKSIEYFKKIMNEFPQSPLHIQAETWTEILRKINKQKPPSELRNKNKQKPPSELNLFRSKAFLKKGNYSKALEENKKILGLPAKTAPKDKALFNIALIYTHHDNPEKDYNKSIEYFDRIINEFPQSPLVYESEVWLRVLNTIEKSKQVDIEIERKKKELSR
jgi:tetratricopeptide (TPR) repeat protein